MFIGYYILLTILLLVHGHNNMLNKRQKRYLLFTSGTQWGVFATVSVPLHPETTVSFAWFFEANYYNVDNSSYFDPLLGDITLSRNREKREVAEGENQKQSHLITRSLLYASIESMLEKHGYNGRPCLLRAICENRTSHFLHNGLLGDLLHLILTPSLSLSEEDMQDCFYEAEYYGLDKMCEYYYEDCPSSPLENISVYIDDLF